ncbi:LuxR family transcriptional regulator [Streptomyces sp. WAC00288]|uniref:helix-turn-helix transcriptional regulator n=1 Tax=unclassified Streptomyces TaxID=2593676 RepID=UPI000788C558|nr:MULTISPECIES: helix-turn-helix transcriptional regulator [unclassified Streptomyces]AVH98760.1 LuxR family transcriptional regulator [Streptomyces sp. WAC00288]KYG52339.1 helix-turn-helix transcriptional regulator [Streptomyces sp. WAC04657]
MMATHGFIGRTVTHVLVPEAAESVLVLLEGAAGTGKSHLLKELSASFEAAAANRVLWWRCGTAETQPQEQPQEGPLLLLVDDVHRAAEEERQRLRHVLERPRPGLAAVVTYRPEELTSPALPLGAPAVMYPPDLTVLRHRLEVWEEERIRRAAAKALEDRCAADVVGRLHEQSGGVPQVVVDLLSAMKWQDKPVYTAEDVDAVGVPVRLAELALSRISAMPPAHRPVAWAAAVLDEPAGQSELVTAAGLEATQGHDALLAALATGVLVELDADRYGFSVPLAALAVRTCIPGPLRQGLHERAAEALTRRQSPAWAAVAAHRKAAGGGRGWLRSVEKAARAAAETGRHQQAISLLEQTLASPLVPPQARARLAPLLARSAVTGLRSDQTVAVLAQIVRDATLPVALRGELRLDLGLMLCNQLGRFASGWHELEVVAAELDGVRPDLAGRAMAALAMPYWPGPSIEVHRQWLQKALSVANASGDQTLHAAVMANHVWFTISCGDHHAWKLLDALPTDSTDPACVRHAARGLCNAADAAAWLGSYERAEEFLDQGIKLSAQSGAPYTEHTALGTQLLLKWWTGQWAGLADQCEKFIAATADMPVIAFDARVVRSLISFTQGDWGATLSWLSESSEISWQNMPTPLSATVSGALIRLALARQDLPAAAEQARTAWANATVKGVWTWVAELAPWAVEATARTGDTNTAQAMIRDFARGISEQDAPAAKAALIWSEAVLTEVKAQGRKQQGDELIQAAKLYREASTAYSTLPRPYFQALLMESAARCTLEAHGPDAPRVSTQAATHSGRKVMAAEADHAAAVRAISELETCTEQFTDLGATWDAARARAVLRTWQPARRGRPPGRASQADQLTSRETEVSQLAANGLTNREIASTLHISPRTVEQHVARAMRKIGALSRQDLQRLRSR